jgi:hypothetical protein
VSAVTTTTTKHTAVLWALTNGIWRQANKARAGQSAVKDARGTKPAIKEVTLDDLRKDLEARRAFAVRYGSKTVYMITEDGKQPASPG